MSIPRSAALCLVFESVAGVWVLNAHLPGLAVSPLPMPPWQQAALVAVLATGTLPLALWIVGRSRRPAPAGLYWVLSAVVGVGLWVALVGVHPRDIPPPMPARIWVAAALIVPALLIPALFRRADGHRRGRLFVWWLFIGTYAICELVAGEAIRLRDWRIMHVESDRYAILVSDARRFYVAPHARWRHVYSSDPDGYFGPDRTIRYRTNSHGLRERELPLAKPPGTFRIAALGDSFTLGEGVRVQDTWPRQLETILRDRLGTDRIEVVNAGVNAYDTRQELEQYRRTIRSYHPDLVIIAMVWNDAHAGDARTFGASFVAGSAALAQYLPLADRIARGIAILFGHTGVPTSPAAWREAFNALEALKKETAADGADLLVAIYPSVRHLDNEPLQRVYALQEAFCQRAGLAVFNAWPVFKAQPPRRWYTHAADNHPNALAHTLFATNLAQRVAPIVRRAMEGP